MAPLTTDVGDSFSRGGILLTWNGKEAGWGRCVSVSRDVSAIWKKKKISRERDMM